MGGDFIRNLTLGEVAAWLDMYHSRVPPVCRHLPRRRTRDIEYDGTPCGPIELGGRNIFEGVNDIPEGLSRDLYCARIAPILWGGLRSIVNKDSILKMALTEMIRMITKFADPTVYAIEHEPGASIDLATRPSGPSSMSNDLARHIRTNPGRFVVGLF